MNIVAKMWSFAEACSHPRKVKERIEQFNPNMIIYTPLQNEDDFGYIAEFEDKVIFSFRGTKGTLKAWIENFKTWPLKDDILKNGSWGDGVIHDGFYTAWSWFKQPITDYIKNIGKKDIYCTGHSRGGALATLCARHIAKNLGIPCSCVSFAAPMQGISSYRDQYNKLPIYHTRVEEQYDIVPTLPPKEIGFRAVGIPLILPQPQISKWFGGRIISHSYSTYTTGLINYSVGQKDQEAALMLTEILKNTSI